MAFQRSDAVKYADKFWNIPADDGIFWLSNEAVNIAQVRTHNIIPTSFWQKAPVAEGWQPFFVDDGLKAEKAVFQRTVGATTEEILINPWAGIADCAHFLSRCLSAGGLKIAERGVPSLVNKLQSLPNTKTLCEQVPKEGGQRVIDSGVFKPGDMIGYFNIDPAGDYGGAKEYTHSTMYVGKIAGKTDGGVTCHTVCRFPGRSWLEDSWWLKPPGHYTYTLIHITDDDPRPDPAKVSAITGWWQLDYGGRTEYYLMQNGSAAYTKKAPTSARTAIHVPEGTAYWFMSPFGDITFTWRKTGTVEVWTPSASGFSSNVNGVPGVLTKLF